MHLDVLISLYRSACLHTSSGIGSRFFCFIVFLRIPVREMIAKTLMCIMSCLSLCLPSSSLKEQCHDSRIQFLRVWDEETLADLIFALRQTLNVYERTCDRYDTFSDLVKYSAYHVDMHYTKQSLYASLCLTIVVVFIHDVYRNYFTKESFFAIISLKVVSQRSVFVTFDLIVVTKILEHKWQSDRRRRKRSETRLRNATAK